MMLAAYLKPAIGAVVVVAVGAGYYWVQHRPRPQATVIPNKASVVVAKCADSASAVTTVFEVRRLGPNHNTGDRHIDEHATSR